MVADNVSSWAAAFKNHFLPSFLFWYKNIVPIFGEKTIARIFFFFTHPGAPLETEFLFSLALAYKNLEATAAYVF